MLKDVYNALKENPFEGDFCQLFTEDKAMLDLKINENDIKNTKKETFKAIVKKKVNEKFRTNRE